MPDTVPAEPAPAGHPLRVRELLPGEDARWDSFVRHHRAGSFYHLSGWRKVVEDVFRHTPHYLVAERGRQWVGALPLFWVKSPFLGKNLISVPYGVYGGLLAEADDVAEQLIAAARSHGQELGAAYVELRHIERQCQEATPGDLYVTFRKPLPADPAEVMPAIPKKARAEVRRAQNKFGLRCEEFRDLDLFFEMFALNKRRLGTPPLPRRWFKALIEEFGSAVALHVARQPDGRPIAAVMSFCFNDTLCSYYSGSRHRYHHTGVNDFIYCKIMEWAVEQGFAVFDFGRSRRDTGPAAFKKNMGFQPRPLHYQYCMLHEGATLPDFNPSNPRLELPRRIWSHLPPIVVRGLSGRLSRYLP